ncbi:MAG: FG-GAP-like repeat-containing protein [Methylovulum sp.]|nr:FG-GAP-like repeat-containing protein [Methylovulum sp.]
MAIPKLRLLAGANPVEGGVNGYFNISLDSPAPAGGLTINFDTTGSTATFGKDYTLMAGANVSNISANTFTIAAGASSATLNLAALADTVADPNETVFVNLIAGMGYALAGSAASFDKVDYATDPEPRSVCVGDFNNDGKTDLAGAEGYRYKVFVLLRNATNTGFDAKVDYAVRGQATSVSVGDFNNDGKTDLAVANMEGRTVSVLLRNATNTGFDAKDVATGYPSRFVSAGDFNNDGKDDLATANYDSHTVSVLLRNATNTGFDVTTVDTPTGLYPSSVSTGDFNNDGKTDLAITSTVNINGLTRDRVSVLLRNATNTGFDPKMDFTTGSSPSSISAGDFNNDGKTDLAVTNHLSETVSVLLNTSSASIAMAIAEKGTVGNDSLNGSEGNDVLNGGLGDDVLKGNAGNDTITGGEGNDRLLGGEGDDVLDGGNGGDWGDYWYATAGVNVNLTLTGEQHTGGAGVDALAGIESLNGSHFNDTFIGNELANWLIGGNGNDNLSGGRGDDRLRGDAGYDTLTGGAGHDLLTGGAGHDLLTGGVGKDSFVFNAALKANIDNITDFKPVDDTIELENKMFTVLTATGELSASQFVKGTNAHDADDYVIYNPTTGAVTYDSDGNGIAQGVQIAMLGVHLALTSADFVVI